MQTEVIIQPQFAAFDPSKFSAEIKTPNLSMPTFVEATGVAAVDATSDFNPSIFGRPDFSAVNNAAFRTTPEMPVANKVDTSDFKVNAPTVQEAENMRLEASVKGVGHAAVANSEFMQLKAQQDAAIAQAESMVRNAFLEIVGDSDDEVEAKDKKVLATV
jgi:hypothetical protein